MSEARQPMLLSNQPSFCLPGPINANPGAIGYCAYAPSKYAVRGLMESLRNEVING